MPINYDQSGVVYDSTVYTWDGEVRTSTVFPIVGVFVAFNDGPYTANPGWQEITPYVRAVSTHRGRSNDLEQFDTGTAQLVLDNRDRRFDPFYTSGPYYTKLTPRRQIRIIGQIGGSNYDVFRGYIAGWPVTWSDAGKDSTVTIQCFDALGLMANETVPTDWPQFYTRAANPYAYWKLDEAQTAATTVEQIGSTTWSIGAGGTNAARFRQGNSATATTPGTSTYFNDYYFFPAWGDATSGTPPWGSFSNAPANVSFCGFGWNPSGAAWSITLFWGRSISVSISAAGVLTVSCAVNNGGGLNTKVLSFDAGTQRFNPGIPTHFAVVASTVTGPDWDTLTVYINGQQITGTTSTTTGGSLFIAKTYLYFNIGSFQEIAFFQAALTAAQAQAIGQACANTFSETTTARMNRLIGTTDYPTLLASFTASPAATVAEIGTGANVIPEMQLVADSEGGELYVNKSGILTTTNRTDVFTATRSAVSQATITDSGSGLKYGTELNIQWDADNLKNDVTVNYSGGGQVEIYNDATIAGYGAASTVIETQLADPTSANQLALMELGVEGSLIPQISPIDLSPNTAATDWQTILGLELLDRVTFKRTPTVGNQFNRDALINAIDHQIAPGVWNTQVTLSMRYTSPLTLDDDILGTLDLNYLG